ncbi:MAG TPA: gamma-glutamyl-phosphate reductase, partial [Corynebacterium sp.]|nr:gamma-glutamyl-phosphate reductase [Corynebacterium sp.]
MTDLTPERQAERDEVLRKARAAKQVAPLLATLPTPRKNEILLAAAEDLVAATEE